MKKSCCFRAIGQARVAIAPLVACNQLLLCSVFLDGDLGKDAMIHFLHSIRRDADLAFLE